MTSCLAANVTSEPIYTNIVPTELEADWTTSYTGAPRPVQPAYVDGYEVGVAVSEIRTFDYRAASKSLCHVTSSDMSCDSHYYYDNSFPDPSQPVTMATHGCVGPSPSPDSPVENVIACSTGATPSNLTAHTFLHGDR